MVCSCSAYGCKNRRPINGVSFYRFPADAERRRKWVIALRRENWKPAENSRLCSVHFVGGRKSDDPLSPAYVPSVFSFVSARMKIKLPKNLQRHERRQDQMMRRRLELEHDYVVVPQRRQKEETEMASPAYEPYEWNPDWGSCLNFDNTEFPLFQPSEHQAWQEMVYQLQPTPQVKDEEIETVIVGGHENMEENTPVVNCLSCAQKCAEMKKLEEKIQKLESTYATECNLCKLRRDEINRLLEENRALKSQLEKVNMEEPFFQGNNKKVHYYTGLPDFDALTVLVKAVEPFLPKNVKHFSSFQMVVLTFMRLRLNQPVQFLIYHFQTNWRMLAIAFTQTISALNAHFSNFAQWPSREALQAASKLPPKISASCVEVIVDVLEVLSYKGPTVKYLISATPEQTTFISKGFEDDVGEKHIIENSGILEKLVPGDLVLADYVYELKENSEGGRSLTELPIEEKEGNRFPVKKVMMNLRRFAILTGEVPSSLLLLCEGEELTLLDKVVRVCCALSSMWPIKSKESSSTE